MDYVFYCDYCPGRGEERGLGGREEQKVMVDNVLLYLLEETPFIAHIASLILIFT